MTKKIFLPTMLIAVFFLLAVSLSAQPLLLKDQNVLVTLGDSITEGGEQPEGYVSIMRKALSVLYPEMTVYIINSGISGHKSTDMNDRFQRDVLQYQPQWVTISVGVNDVWHGFYDNHPKGDGPRGVPLDSYKNKVIDMVERAARQNAAVALFTSTVIKENLDSPENQKLALYNQAMREIAKKYHCVLVDQDASCRKVLMPQQKPGMADRGILTTDGVHMLPAGNWLMAKTCLIALGVPNDRLELAKPLIDDLIAEDQERLQESLDRYVIQNFELGPAPEKNRRVVFFGSSSVEQWKLIKDFPTVAFLNRGIGGETTRQMWLRFRQDVLSLNPAAVILHLGSGNDFWPENKMCPGHTLANLTRMVRMAQSKGIRVAVGTLMPVNDYVAGKDYLASHPVQVVQSLNRQIMAYCQSQSIPIIDFYSAVADPSGKLAKEYSDDGMHCNRKGYIVWKPLVEAVLKTWDLF